MIRNWKNGTKINQKIAGLLATVLLLTPIFTYLPPGIFDSWGFGLVFVSSGQAGHPYLLGKAPGEERETYFFCMNKGASAHSNYDYSKVNMDIDYNQGTIEQKRMFWAYIGAFGSYDGKTALTKWFGRITPEEGREVAWSKGKSNGGSEWIENMANDGFMSLANIPPGCKSPKDILELVSKYNTVGQAMYINDLKSGPGQIDTKKLYELTGLSDWETFKKYCNITPITPGMIINTEGENLSWSFPNTPAGQKPDEAVIKITYDPAIFKVLEVTGSLEYFQCNVPGSQQLYRAKGNLEEISCEFYLTTKYSSNTSTPAPGDAGEVSLKIYRHDETFESNYKVDLEKRDYETGHPLEGSTWQVLERFDDSQLSDDESDGGIIEENMREDPTTWEDWLVFDDDLVTDSKGRISHKDTRFYDFSHAYCNGHPIPPEPDESEGGEEGSDEAGEAAEAYERLMEEWQAALDECEARSSASGGTFHHWECGREEEPSEEEAFEASGCKDARDDAYQTFINLEYDYTFRETKPRDGYIIHPGHPDDVPIEIITTAASESGRAKTWKSSSNADIRVTGYVRNMIKGNSGGKDVLTDQNELPLVDNDSNAASLSTSSDASEESGDLILKETYDLPLGERIVNQLLKFIGLPTAFVEEKEITVKLIAKDDKESYDEELDEEEEEEYPDEHFSLKATPPQARKSFMGMSLGSALRRKNKNLATDSEASIPKKEKGIRQISLSAEDTDEEPVMTTPLDHISLSGVSGKGAEEGEKDSQPEVEKGPGNHTAHTFMVYDHRVPGQVHFNKKDMELKAGESESYHAYGDSQGDATLEGAVYGLFAADPIYGPDTQRDDSGNIISGTGVLFDANDLVAVAATDKNGDGSFLTITERPHSVYDYKHGEIQYTGKPYPGNLYVKNGYEKAQPQEEQGRIYKDNKTMNGDSWIGRPLILGSYYIKELTRSEGYELSITGKDMEFTNASGSAHESYGNTADAKTDPIGSAWISKQLYHAVTFPEGNAAYGNKENLLLLETKSKDATNGYDVVLDGVPEGAEIYLNNVTLNPVVIEQVDGGSWVDAKEAPFYMTAESNAVYKRDINGNMIEKPEVTASIKIPYEAVGTEADKLPTEGTAIASDPARFARTFTTSDSNINYVKAELEQMMRESLHMETPKDGDYSTAEAPVYDERRTVNGKTVYGKPEMVLEIDHVTTNKSVIEAVLTYYINEKVFTYGGLQKIEYSDGKAIATVVVGMNPGRTLLYQTNSSGDIVAAYLTKLNKTYGRYVIRKYTGNELNAAETANTGKYIIKVTPDYEVGDDGIPTDKTMYPTDSERYLRYDAGETLYDYWYLNGGAFVGHAPITRKVWEANYKEVIVNEENVNASKITKVGSLEEVADRTGSTYYYYDKAAKQYIIHVGTKDMDLTGVKSGNFTIALQNGKTRVTSDDISKIGSNNVWGYTAGESISNAEYVIRVSGAGAGAFTSTKFDSNKTFIKSQHLICNGYHDLLEDGNTRETPTPVLERIIGQQIKVTKTIDEETYINSYAEVHNDWFTKTFGGHLGGETAARKMDNFRFKVYLKSNLERLYRDNDGNVVWQDRQGNEIDVIDQKEKFPALVNKTFTKVQHVTSPLYKDSGDAIVSNHALYSYTDGFINADQNNGYTSVLETIPVKTDSSAGARIISSYNYDKFFNAINVANDDKWDRTDHGSASFKPPSIIKKLLFGTGGGEKQYPAVHNNPDIKNQINTSDIAAVNAMRSDNVRQFAITWYLDDEVAKLVKKNQAEETESATGGSAYSEEVYDKALSEAIRKAENYLKPFFAYDLDRIYSIEWDSAQDGGSDKDYTTLSADTLYGDVSESSDGYYFATSKYLPYGNYVVAEQQPRFSDLEDFKNKHYQIDQPREVSLPSVYADYDGSQAAPEVMNHYYDYSAGMTQPEMERKFKIRFNEESVNVIKGRNADGDFEVYKYGMDIDNIRNGVTEIGSGDYFALSQNEFRPFKNYYNGQDDRTVGTIPYYLSEGSSGREAVSKYYRYSSVAENKGIADDVPFPGGTITENNDAGNQYKDHVATMQGVQTAYDGKYAPMLVPWTVVASDNAVTEKADSAISPDGESSYKGFGYTKFRNSFYKAKLRIEKLDSETGENILHDGAIFTLYAASREDGKDTDGLVKFYEKDTLIKGSKEFLEAMGASDITPAARGPIGSTWTGTVPAGTPVCEEAERIILNDKEGNKTGQFKAFTTTRDGLQADEKDLSKLTYSDQNTGYLETPQPLGAGTYVLCEIKPTSGYARTKPVAIEVYSDKISYYLDGNRDDRVAAAIYEEEDKPGAKTDMARIYVNNTPIRLEVSKAKARDKTATYKTNTRLEGTQVALKAKYGAENLEYAYKNGRYLGYAWYKGTLEYLESRKAAGEDVQPVYVDGVFAGYGLISRPLDTADDKIRYVAGAKMTLYEAIEVRRNGDSGDYGYDGVEVTRDRNNNVNSIKVLEGYAGEAVKFVKEEDAAGSLEGGSGNGKWTYQTIQRKDTDILYYSLGGLKVTETGTDGILYGYDRDGNRVQVKNQSSVYALKGGQPVFEITGGDLEAVRYSSLDKCFTKVNPDTIIYHLDQDGNRDSMVHPTTGMAYVMEKSVKPDGKEYEKILVWPVRVSKTANGAVIAREKIKTYRIASIHADTEREYTIGTYDGKGLKKYMNPVLNGHGLIQYYQRSDETYQKGRPIYDIDGDYVRYKYEDLLPAYNDAAYSINGKKALEDVGEKEDITDDKELFHRQGEAWVLENTWVSGDRYPNDPFQQEIMTGQADMLKRVIPRTYIMEELEAPDGYIKGFPTGITVQETTKVQKAEMEDQRIKVEIVKTDAANQYKLEVSSDYQTGLTVTEPKGGYGYGQIKGAHLTLYKAKRILTTDYMTYPKGYYLVKAENKPAEWMIESTLDNTPVRVVADWITDGTPKYFEGIPAGDYILEETEAVSGYVRSVMELEVKATGELQTINMKNDHTKLEIYKYYRDSNGMMAPLPNDHAAELTLYEAKMDENGGILMNAGVPQYDPGRLIDTWTTDDLKQYTELYEKKTQFMERFKDFLGLTNHKSSFITDFEREYKAEGGQLRFINWYTKDGERFAERKASVQTEKGENVVQTWQTDQGNIIRITIYRNVQNGSLDENGKLPLIFEYQFNYKEQGGIQSYDTLEGMHRIDYLPFNTEKDGKKVGNYVLVETKVPDGFEAAKPKAVVVTETGNVQRFSLENEEKYINVLKVVTDGTKEYSVEGAKLALYRADASGNFTGEEAYLVETWVSGTDGRYTEEDKWNGKIPEGFGVGDVRPHRINKVPYGIYYIVELEAPDYMEKCDPVRIEVGADTKEICRVVNQPSQGTLIILKKASDTGNALENARFKVTNQTTGDTWYMTTDQNGRSELPGLPVGKVKPDGTITPYTYVIEELSPPDRYQITSEKKTFQFGKTGNGKPVTYTYELENKPTEIHFRKTNFDTGMAVEGAKIAVYKAKALDGVYVKDGEPLETVISGKDGFTLKKVLTANHVYIMEELEAPAGMHRSKPVIFTVNKSGTGILNVSNHFSVMKLACDDGTIEALTVNGRVAVKVYTVLRDLDNGRELPPFYGTGNSMILTAEDGVEDGHLYEITEYTGYSDGNEEKTWKETKRLFLDEDGTCPLMSRSYLKTRMELKDQEGNVLDTWSDDENREHTIRNPVSKEKTIAMVTSEEGKGFRAVQNGSVMKYAVTYQNPYNWPVDVKVKAKLNDNLDYMRSTGNGSESNGIVTWVINDAEPHTEGKLEVVAAVSGVEGGNVEAQFTVKSGDVTTENTLINPIAPPGSLTIVNHLTGTGKSEKDLFTYDIRFMDQEGDTLTGYQAYNGSLEGRVKGEGKVNLKENEYITFAGLPYGTKYEVNLKAADGYSQSDDHISGEISNQIKSAVFTSSRDDETIREILTAGGNYTLTETTSYTDGTEQASGIYRFSLNPSGSVDNVDMEDKPVKLYFSKVDVASSEELAGGRYSLMDAESGATLYEFIKEEHKKVLIPAELLIPGREYLFREDLAPAGYAYEETIRFKVDDSGVTETIVMQDQKTDIALLKTDASTGEALIGGRYEIRDPETGESVFEFTATGIEIHLEGILTAGHTYELVELEPPAGYAYSKSITFVVPKEPGTIHVTMKDEKTEIIIEKLTEPLHASPSEASAQMPGFILQILNLDKTPAKAIRDFNGFKAGEDLVFTTGDQFRTIAGQLTAGGSYWLHEIKPRDGYAFAEDVPFTVSRDGEKDTVVMADKPTHVILSKKDITGVEELPGNQMSIRDQDGNTVEEWISGTTPHEIQAKLVAGKTYYLHEIDPLDGYAYAEDVPFVVSLDGSVDMVEMKNDKTKVRIHKVDQRGNALKGAVLQVLDERKQVVIHDFTTEGKPIDITGKLIAGERYFLHEVKAPAGYLLSADVPFTVPKEVKLLEITMTDPKRSSPNPGPDNDQMYVRKTDAVTGAGLPGFEFTIFNPDGSVLMTVVTGKDGYARFDMPEDGFYIYKETKAKDGYLLSDETYTFTVKNRELTDNSTVSVSDQPVPEIRIEKADGITKALIPGATIKIWNDDGWSAAGVTKEDGSFLINPPKSGLYYLQEIEAPAGYSINQTVYQFVINPDGSVSGTTMIYNYKDTTPGKKVGRVTAFYSSELSGRGYMGFGTPGRHVPGAKTGDNTPVALYLGLFGLSLSGLFTGIWLAGKKKKRHSGTKLFAALLILFSMMAGHDAYAAASEPAVVTTQLESAIVTEPTEQVELKGDELTVTYPANAQKPTQMPDSVYEYEGKVYNLERFEIINSLIPQQMETISETVKFEHVEQIDRIPYNRNLEVTDKRSGEVLRAKVSLKGFEYSNERWTDNFEFTVLVEEADSDAYALRNVLIPKREQAPFKSYEKQLLDLIHVNPDYYKIRSVEWSTDQYGKNGIVYREAMAKGSKLVCDVAAIYEGEVLLPEINGYAMKAVYKPLLNTKEGAEKEVAEGMDHESELWNYLKALIDFIKNHPVISISVGIVILTLGFVLILHVLSKRNSERGDGNAPD